MSKAEKRKRDRAELDELYRKVEHARNEEIALRAISIAEYWLNKAEKQAMQIRHLEERNKRVDMRGEWIEENDYMGFYDCSECGYKVGIMNRYCPNCGADMRGDSDG